MCATNLRELRHARGLGAVPSYRCLAKPDEVGTDQALAGGGSLASLLAVALHTREGGV